MSTLYAVGYPLALGILVGTATSIGQPPRAEARVTCGTVGPVPFPPLVDGLCPIRSSDSLTLRRTSSECIGLCAFILADAWILFVLAIVAEATLLK